MTRTDIVVPVALQHTQTVTCTSPWYVQDTEYPPAKATFQPLINGEEAFKAVHLAIAKATKTVDIICWGFQPSMFFIRDGKHPSIGELLKTKARQGVKVRVLSWEMPLNSAGYAGEANLPGKGTVRLRDRALQSSTPAQYEEDRRWFAECAVSDNKAVAQLAKGLPALVSRGFDLSERAEIARSVKDESLDFEISARMRHTLRLTASHHQKSVLVDYELPDGAVGFVMGHNLLDEYWDTQQHSALNRTEETKPAPNVGARGNSPRQDISSQLSGPIVEHLHHNFASAWLKETGEDLFDARQSMQIGPQLQCLPGATRQIAQVLRTQAQAGKRDIEKVYLNAVNNATQFIYIENQYFRWPPLAEVIKKAAADQTGGGRDPGLHGALHVFVITNATDDGMGAGTVNTQRMLESLGRANTIPGVTKLRRIERMKAAAPPRPTPDLRDRAGQRELAKWQADVDQKTKAIEDSTVVPQEMPGLKIHVCSLVAADSPAGKPWMPVYIHSKLMIVDDVFTTLGSANINTRSMQVDSELNIAHEWVSETQALRRRLWGMHTGGRGGQDDPAEAFIAWDELIKENQDLRDERIKGAPSTSLVGFYYGEKSLKDLD
jgi:phosphatidylserine/phosphatidylglycerophosphate/cardiolipin synthase-like enzyme